MSSIHTLSEDDAAGLVAIARFIGERPETLMSLEQARRGRCRLTLRGELAALEAVAVQPAAFPGDVSLYGDDLAAVWALLQQLEGWRAADVAPAQARPLAEWLGWAQRRPVVFSRELFFTLDDPAPAFPHPAVRLLTAADLPLLEAATAPLGMGDWRFGSAAALLAEGVVAGAVLDDAVAAVAFTAAQGARYADVGVATRSAAHGRGLATAAAALVCAAVQAGGRIPVWGASADNAASLRVAAKLGFHEVGQRVYLNLA